MRFLDRLADRVADRITAKARASSAPDRSVQHGGGSYESFWTNIISNYPLLGERGKVKRPFSQSPSAYRSVKLLSDSVAGVPIELFQGDTDNVVEKSNPIARVFANPCPQVQGSQFMMKTVQQLILFGNAVWFNDEEATVAGRKGGGQFPTRIYVLRSESIKPWIENGKHLGFESLMETPKRRWSWDMIQWFYYPNPYDETWGLSPFSPLSLELEADRTALLSNLRAVRRGTPAIVVESMANSVAEYAGDEGDRILKKTLDDAFMDEKDHSSIVLPPGRKPTVVGMGARDMEFDKGRRMSREVIGGTLGAMPGAMGILEYANYANMGQQLNFLYQLNVFPLCDYLGGVIQSDLLDRWDTGIRIYFAKEKCRALYEDLKQLSEVTSSFMKNGIPLDKINERLELGFDLSDLPHASEPLYGADLRPFDSLGILTRAVDPTPPPKPEQANRFRKNDLTRQELERTIRWNGIVSKVNDIEARAYRAVRPVLIGASQEIIANLRKVSVLFDEAKRHDIAGDVLFEFDAVTGKLKKALDPNWRAALDRGANALLAEVGADLSFSLLDPRVLSYLASKNMKIRNVTDTLREEARRIINEGIAQGWTVDQMAEALRESFESPYRSRLIARTETIDAFSEGRHDAMILAGVESKEWLTARDDRVRESHIEADGQVVPLGEPFTLGSGASMMRPLDDTLGAEAGDICNCRCVELAVIS